MKIRTKLSREFEVWNQSPLGLVITQCLRTSRRWMTPLFGIGLASSVITANAQIFDNPFQLSDLVNGDGTKGFVINGVAPDDRSGNSVAAAGDVNGDGFDDVIIGVYRYAGFQTRTVASYVVFGSEEVFPAMVELSMLDGTNGFVINGRAQDDDAGLSVSGAGDINNDGLDDIIVGAPNDRNGSSYVIFGTDQGFPSEIELSALNGDNGFSINGITRFSDLGISVSAAGDVNGDLIDDLILGAPRANADVNGASYVVFGSNQSFPATLELSDLDGANGFAIHATTARFRFSGGSVSEAGDINGDGLDDVIIGAKYARINGENSGASYVVFGSNREFPAAITPADLNGTNGFIMNGAFTNQEAGVSVSGAGDVNGDGIDDLIIGAYFGSGSNPGSSYVVFGSTQTFPAQIELSALDGTVGFQIKGAATEDYSGEVVSGAGDINGDGLSDVIIGAPNSNRSSNYRGAGFVVFGSRQSYPPSIELAELDGIRGFAIDGANEYNFAGRGVSAAGDINGDGVDDLIIGARSASPDDRSAAGESYIIFGKSQPGDPEVTLSIEDRTVNENDSAATVTLRLSQASRDEVTVTVHTLPDTAINGQDFYGWTKTVRFAPGMLSAEVALAIIDDFKAEGDESFRIRVAAVIGARVRDGNARVNIVDNDAE